MDIAFDVSIDYSEPSDATDRVLMLLPGEKDIQRYIEEGIRADDLFTPDSVMVTR